MVNLPCRELLLQLQQGVALGKGRSAPNASPSRDCPRQCTRDQSLDPFSGLCPEPHIAMGRGKQSLTAPLQGECPGQRGCKGLPDRRRSAYCPFTSNHVTGRDQGRTDLHCRRQPPEHKRTDSGICKPGSPKDRQTHRDNHAGHRTAHPSLILEKKSAFWSGGGAGGTPCKKPSSSRYQRRRFLPYNGKATPGG